MPRGHIGKNILRMKGILHPNMKTCKKYAAPLE